MSDEERPLRTLLRHIKNVQAECELLAERLIEQEKPDLARQLVANSMCHDNTKFRGVEWEFLNETAKAEKPDQFKSALQQHRTTNPHHPEYWGGVEYMPTVYVAEMVCDWKARSDEFGTDLRDWVKNTATKQWSFTTQSKVYREIKEFLDLLLDQKFK